MQKPILKHNNENEIDIKNVYYVQGIGKNILSFSRITKNNCTDVAKNNDSKIFNHNRKLLAVAHKNDNLYKNEKLCKKESK